VKRTRKSTLVLLVLATALVFGQTSCGILLNPERTEATRGRLDAVAVVLDCCWFLAGIVPGVVALGVDLVTGGAWHTQVVVDGPPTGELVMVRISGRAPAACEISLRFVDASGDEIGLPVRARVAQGKEAKCLTIAIPTSAPPGAELVLAIDGREQGRWMVADRERGWVRPGA
jgi:hypothetical protein